jgi:tripartite ATP-independent transporter DctM subunit
MDATTIGFISIAVLIVMILMGFHIGVALSTVSLATLSIMRGSFEIGTSMLVTTAYSGVMDYVFAVIPLFVLMGLAATESGAIRELFDASQIMLRGVRGGLGIATVIANAIFAAITGVSVASAAVFSRLAIPEMQRLNYDHRFSLGIVASTALLGMLIPPSVLMIVYGVITEQSIGRLFAAGFMPGLLVSVILSAGIVGMITWNPRLGGLVRGQRTKYERPNVLAMVRPWPIYSLIALVLGGIWGGLFTPTEAGAVGAGGAMVLMIARGKMTRSTLLEVMLECGKTVAVVFFLLIAAQMYSRMLTLSGVPTAISAWAVTATDTPLLIIIGFMGVLLILGCLIDSVSILLLTMPIMAPVAFHLGYDPIWFGIVVIVTVEIGLITPPFGMVVFAMKASLPDDVLLEDIFMGSMPFLIMLFGAVALLVAFPQITLWLPNLLFGS